MPKKQTVKGGDCMSSLSKAAGFRSHKTLYDDPDNRALRARRTEPSELHPGDEVIVPDFDPGVEDAMTTKRTTFVVVREDRTFLRIRLRHRIPLAYRLTTDLETLEGSTNGVEDIVAAVSRDARSASLLAWVSDQAIHPDNGGPALRRRIDLGCLAPIDTLRGIQGRLRNLGYDAGPLVEDPAAGCDALTAEAIRAFQAAHGSPRTGKPDDVRQLLEQLHDA